MSDQIILEQIQTDAFIGIHDYEHAKAQPITIDVELSISLQKAGQSDEYADTLCYSQVYQTIIAIVKQKHYHLVEHLAETICTTLLSEFSVTQINIKILKTSAISGCAGVGVKMSRPSDD